MVLATQVLEHVPEPKQMLQEISRVLRPGGHLILTAPHIWGIHEAPHDYFRFTHYGLEYLARQAGLHKVYIKAMGGFWVTWSVRLSYYVFPERVKNPLVRNLFGAFCFFLQLVGMALDKIHRVEGETHNYILLAVKT